MTRARVLILASGSGTLAQALIDASVDKAYPAQVVGVISDVVAPVIERATAAGIATRVIEMTADRSAWNEYLRDACLAFSPDLIVSAGFMRILGAEFLAAFPNRVINTHPALLPAFPGAHAVRDALDAGVTITGTTVHFVDEGVDTGPVITQREVPVLANDTESTLHERIKIVERELLVATVRELSTTHHQPGAS